MDPDAAFESFRRARQSGNLRAMRDAAIALQAWLAVGGFPPGDMSERDALAVRRASLRITY